MVKNTLLFSFCTSFFFLIFHSYKAATFAATLLMTNSPRPSGAFTNQALSTFTAVLPLLVAAERMEGIPRRQECTEEHLLPRRVHRLLTAWEAHSPHRCFYSPINTGLVLFNMAGLSSHAQSMLPSLHTGLAMDDLSACCYLLVNRLPLAASESTAVL